MTYTASFQASLDRLDAARDQGADNLDVLHAAVEGLDKHQTDAVFNHLLGGVSDLVDPAIWAAALFRAIKHATATR